MTLKIIPDYIRKQGEIAIICDPETIKEIQSVVSIALMIEVKIRHFIHLETLEALEALEALNIDFLDERELLTSADETYHINKRILSFHLNDRS